MKNNKIKGIVKYIFISLFVTFVALYFSIGASYFEYTNGKKAALTEAQIQKFEKDVADGKEIDVEKYLEEKGNYQNGISKFGLAISNTAYKVVNKGVGYGFKLLEKLTSSS